ncbi:NADPH-dependent aldehyde reductase Ahr [Roseateles amylovorans]|uniref:NAD(P)-dependent alcohol dehydrogenase n=1 Tax=Roseateles amylovorans TaxID=2978473 RepID=A0ABY6B420_9BURK|nr:NAD(P)-dependent alcohol dehydrogenase [Roseateles amylovorans]UXH80118.1 NAD(P)-dependent alcohol dehydrogenase [Roseateles amylovorans]
MTTIHAWAATEKGGPLQRFDFDSGPLGEEEVAIRVEHCGICHSDLAMIDSEWFPSTYPVVPGHEVIGVITEVGARVKGRQVGQRVGIGWHTGSCMHCGFCLGGEQHLCGQRQPTIIGRHGGFADRLHAHWAWAVPIPDNLDPAAAGPLMCGGGTVFLPFVLHSIKPTDRVGVVGIGGLGHLAVKFARAWGCEVTAFTSSPSKREEALALGAHKTLSSVDTSELKAAAGSLDFLQVTVGASLNWDALIGTLAAKGRFHLVGVVTDKLQLKSGGLLSWQRSVSASPTPPPTTLARMLEFAARHQILPQVERFPMSRVNEALDHLRANKARYRIVLDAETDGAAAS